MIRISVEKQNTTVVEAGSSHVSQELTITTTMLSPITTGTTITTTMITNPRGITTNQTTTTTTSFTAFTTMTMITTILLSRSTIQVQAMNITSPTTIQTPTIKKVATTTGVKTKIPIITTTQTATGRTIHVTLRVLGIATLTQMIGIMVLHMMLVDLQTSGPET